MIDQTPQEKPGQHTTRSTLACADNENNDSGNSAESEAAWLEDIIELLTEQDPYCDHTVGSLAVLAVPVLPIATTVPVPGAGAVATMVAAHTAPAAPLTRAHRIARWKAKRARRTWAKRQVWSEERSIKARKRCRVGGRFVTSATRWVSAAD